MIELNVTPTPEAELANNYRLNQLIGEFGEQDGRKLARLAQAVDAAEIPELCGYHKSPAHCLLRYVAGAIE